MAAQVICTRREGAGQVLEARTWLPGQSCVEAFPFFADAFNLETLTPAWLRFRVVTPPPIDVREGTVIDYRLRLHGVPIRWRSVISEWRPPHGFVDTQVVGPYARWRHEHRLIDIPGGVVAADRIRYRIRGGPLVHAIAAATVANRDLERIFAYRSRVMRAVLAPSGLSEQPAAA